MTPEKGDWSLENIRRREGTKKGTGAKVMRAVGKMADKRNRNVGLQHTHGDLAKYYQQFGYELNSTETSMKRKAGT